MKYSQELIIKAKEYLVKKTGEQPSEDTVLQFLGEISEFGYLIVKNATKIIEQN